MRNSFFLLIAMILVTGSASAQWRPNPFFFVFKGVKADSLLLVPKDTLNTSLSDSGAIAFKNRTLWVRDQSGFKEIGFRVSSYLDSLTKDSSYISPEFGPWTQLYIESSILINKRILSVQSESIAHLTPALSFRDLETEARGSYAYYYESVRGRIWIPWVYSASDKVRIRVIYADF